MSDYEYDTGSTRLVISEGLNIRDDKHFVIVSAEHLNDVNIAVAVQDEDAPAVALAILEAAGIKPAWDEESQSSPGRWASKAVEALTYSVKHRAEIAEREAEDAKVRAFLDAMQAEYEEITEGDRSYYRAARKFFEES